MTIFVKLGHTNRASWPEIEECYKIGMTWGKMSNNLTLLELLGNL